MKLWMDDGRTPDHGHPISSPCEPKGSGELKSMVSVCFKCMFLDAEIRHLN